MRRLLMVCGLLPALLLHCPGGVLAKGPREQPAQTRAVLSGVDIPTSEVALHHCHDLMYPVYTCFQTEAQRDADALALSADIALGPLSSTGFTYALAYEAIDYGGNSLLISTSIPDLGTLGWNNRISSFKSTNGGHPKWWAGAAYSGLAWHWGISAWVPYVGSAANDQFSSVMNVP
jgi:hypothetical protein